MKNKLYQLQKTSIYLISLAIFIVFNFLISYLPLRIDFSSGKAYTLSRSTKKVLSQLDDIVNLKLFISSDLPLRLLPLKTDVIDLVNEYKNQGKGKIIIKILDPKKDEKAKDEARSFGLPELQFSQIERDKYAVSAAYFGMGIQYQEKKEIIPQMTNIGSLEYDITSAIYKLTRKKPIKIGLLGIKEFVDPKEDEFYTLKKILQQQFELEFPTKINQSLKTILVFDDNKKQYATSEVEMISDYLDKGGRAIFMVDGVYVDEGLTTKEATHNLFSLFEGYGLKLNKNFVLSETAEMASFSTGIISFFTPYPFWLKTDNFLEEAVEFSNIHNLFFPWASSVDINKKDKIETRILVKSEKNSWEQKNNFILIPNNIPLPSKEEIKEFNLIVEAKKKSSGQFILIPSSRFVKEQFLNQGQENLAFLINLLNNYASEGILVGIRNRAVFIGQLNQIPEATKDLIKYLNILLLPGIVGIVGGIRLIKRK